LHLGAAAQALKGWRKARPTQSYPPLTWACTVAIAVQMARHGREDMGLACLLAFDSLLRIGEVSRLFREDIVLGDCFDPRVDEAYRGSGMRIRTAKTGKEQWADIISPAVRVLLRQHIMSCPPRSKLFTFTSDQFRRLFDCVCGELRLPAAYVPHSLRHGGATLLFLLGVPIDKILIRGRWAERKSARVYIQSGRALLLAREVPIAVAMAGRVLSHDIPRAFAEARVWVRANSMVRRMVI